MRICFIIFIMSHSMNGQDDGLLRMILRPLFGPQPFFLLQNVQQDLVEGLDGSQAFSNQVLSQNSSISTSTVNENGELKRRKKLKTRRRENRFGRRGKLITSINHGKTSLTRFRKGELFSVEIFTATTSRPTTLITSTTSTPSSTTSTAPQQSAQFANQVLGSPLPNITNTNNDISTGNSSSVPVLETQVLLTTEDLDIGVTNFRHLGGVGECRHDFHCIGSESCVNFRGNFICTRRFCNNDRDCHGKKKCIKHRCKNEFLII